MPYRFFYFLLFARTPWPRKTTYFSRHHVGQGVSPAHTIMAGSDWFWVVRTGWNPKCPQKFQLLAPGYAWLQLNFLTGSEILQACHLRGFLGLL